jgi:metal-responsive CopG/Arc/MetJ family transcriptional regulator
MDDFRNRKSRRERVIPTRVNLSPVLLERLDRKAEEAGVSRSEVLRGICAEHFRRDRKKERVANASR